MKEKTKLFLGSLFAVAAFILFILFAHDSADSEKNLKIYFLDVGQGDSEYIKMPSGEDILIDGGPDDKVLSELGKVMSLGDRKIDLLVLTHPHADHLIGLVEVINRYEIGEVWETGVGYSSATYDEWKKEIKEKDIPDKFVKAGDEKTFSNGEINFLVLYPLSSLENQAFDNVNNASLVTELKDGNFTSLFLADAEKTAQNKFLDNLSKVTVLKVGHHGSENGLSENLLKLTRPAIGVIEVGKENKFGHPADSVVSLLKSYAVRIFRTDQDGTIEVFWDGLNYSVQNN